MNGQSAVELFQDAFVRFTRGWNAINALREAAEIGLPTAEPKLIPQYLRVAESFVKPNSAEDSPILPDASPEDLALIAREAARGIVRSAQSAVNAAIAVFAHSVLDAAAFDYCRVTRVADPEAWALVIEKRRVELASTRGRSYESLRDELLDSYFEQLEREALLTKVDLLHARCQPTPGWSPMRDYRFDRAILQRLDALRHAIVHEDALIGQVPKLGLEETDYLMRTCWYFMGLVNRRYQIRLNPAVFMRLGDVPTRVSP